MSDLPEAVMNGIETLAKWAARQPDPAKAGGEIAYMLSVAARIRHDGTPEQRAAAAAAVEEWRTAKTGYDDLARRMLAAVGWDQ